jgi:formate hydrogenlyase transcriptional activator
MPRSLSERGKGNLLVVDGDLAVRQTIEAFLAREGYEVRCAPDGQTALMLAEEDPPELILLDTRLPDMEGFGLCRQLHEDHKTANIPVIFISALEGLTDKMKGFEAGGIDYITKPFQAEEVLARVETHLTLQRLQTQVEVKNAQLEQEIIKSKQAEQKVRQAAEEWRTTFDSIKDPVSMHDKDFRIIKVNKAFAHTFQMEPREVVGKKCYEIIHATKEPWSTCPHRQTLEFGKTVTEEFFEPRLGRVLEVSVSPILNGKNEVVGSVHIMRDVTERQRAQEALRRAHDELEERVKERTADLATANEQLVASEKALEERLKFETLLAEISAHFVNLPADRIDSGIEDAQRRVCELLDLDRSSLFQVPEREPETLLLTHVYQPPGTRIPPERMSLMEFFPWALQKALGGETITISKMTDLPAEAGRDRETFGLYGTRSVVVVPLSVGRRNVFGLLSFAVMREEREWPETLVQQFKLVAQIFANALARKQAEETLREEEAKLGMAINAAGAGLWIVEPDSGHVWATPKTRELFLFAPDEELNYESFFKAVHPEDRDRVNEAVKQALESGEGLLCDYRIALPDGNVRWMVARGQRHPGLAGGSDRLMGVSLDITERKRAEQALEERLRFETLLTEISTRFVNQPVDRIDREIEDAERRICELLGLDLSALWQWSDEAPNTLTLTHLYIAQDGPQPPERMIQEDFPWYVQQMLAGRIVAVSSLEELPAEADRDRESCRLFGVKSNLSLPLSVGGGPPVGVLGLNTTRAEHDWPDALVKRLQLIAQIFANALERKRMEDQLRERLRDIEALKQRLEQENVYLQEEIKLLDEHSEIIGQSLAMKRVLGQVNQVAKTDSTVLILGETGTGKELLARAIHKMSGRRSRPLVAVNCASLPPTLIESELFGRERGAYTGALTKMVGRFELANGSTLFLDEIGEIPLELQSKLLRVLEEGKFERLGSTKTLQVDVRIIAATNRDVAREVEEGRFRKDLFYRLNVFPIEIPPLRERPEDIPLMVWAFVKEFREKMGKKVEGVSKGAIEALQSYPWVGNVRELRNVIERAMIMSSGKTLVVQALKHAPSETSAVRSLEDMERRHIVSVLERHGWRVGGKGGAAQVLGLKRSTLYSKMKKLGIDRPHP